MKTIEALVSQLAKNHNQTYDLIKQLAEVQDNNKDVLDQLLNLDTSYLDVAKSEEEDPSPGFLSGDRAVVLVLIQREEDLLVTLQLYLRVN